MVRSLSVYCWTLEASHFEKLEKRGQADRPTGPT